VFGTSGAGSGAKAASGAKGGGATDASRGTSDAAASGGSGSTGDQSASAQMSSTLAQVSNTLASVFANKSDGTSTAESPPKSPPAASSCCRICTDPNHCWSHRVSVPPLRVVCLGQLVARPDRMQGPVATVVMLIEPDRGFPAPS